MVDKKSKDEIILKPDAVHGEAASESFFTRLMTQFTTAWLFLTRIPLPRWWNTPDVSQSDEESEADKGAGMLPLADTVRAWPVVGILLGALAGLTLWLGASAG